MNLSGSKASNISRNRVSNARDIHIILILAIYAT